MAIRSFEKTQYLPPCIKDTSAKESYAASPTSIASLPTLPYGSDKLPELQKHSRLRTVRSNDYFLAFIAGFCLLTEIGVYVLYTPIMPYQLKSLGYRDVERLTGYLSSGYAGGTLFASPLVGYAGQVFRVSQVFRNKRYLLLCYLLILAASIILFMQVNNFLGMLIGRICQGAAAAGLWTVALSLLSDNVSPTRAGLMTSLAMLGYSVGNTTSQTIGGSLYDALGWKAPSIYALAITGTDVIIAFLFLEKPQPSVNSCASSISEITKIADDNEEKQQRLPASPVLKYSLWLAVKTMIKSPKYMTGLLFSAWYGMFVSGVLNTALTLRLEKRYLLDAQHVGYTFLAIAAPAFLLVPLIGWLIDRLGPRQITMTCLATFIIWLSSLCIDKLPYAAFTTILVGIGMSSTLSVTPVVVYLAAVDREHDNIAGSSLVYGVWNMTYSVSALIFPLLVGTILDTAGLYTGWIIVLAIVAGSGAACLVLVIKYMRLADTPVLELASLEKKERDKAVEV